MGQKGNGSLSQTCPLLPGESCKANMRTKMHRNPIWAALLSVVIVSLDALVSAQAAPRPRACAELRLACEGAGFVLGGARVGNGLFVDCVAPIMRSSPQPRRATKPLPQIDQALVAECKAQNPNFGQRKAAPSQTAEQPAPAHQRNTPPSQGSEPPVQATPIPPAATSPQLAPGPQSNNLSINEE